MFFNAITPATGRELFSTQGAAANLVADTYPGEESGNPGSPFSFQNSLYFRAETPAVGRELWVADASGGRLVKDILPGTDSSYPDNFVSFRGNLYFSADDGVHGSEVWRLAPRDRAVTVSVVGKRFKVDSKGRATIKLKCPATEANGPCTGSIDLGTSKAVQINGKRRKYRLGRASFSIGAGVTKSLKFKFRKPVLKLLGTNPAARTVLARIKVADRLGNQATVLKKLKATVAK